MRLMLVYFFYRLIVSIGAISTRAVINNTTKRNITTSNPSLSSKIGFKNATAKRTIFGAAAISTIPEERMIFNTIYSDYIICANYRSRDGIFQYEKCPRYPSTGFFPFCVYMIVPSTDSQKGYDKHGCVYAHHLPKDCVDYEQYYYEHVTVPFRGQNHSGSMLCCMDNFCNALEEPLFTPVRLKKREVGIMLLPLPLLIAFLIIAAGIWPWIEGKLLKRHTRSIRRLESPGFLDESIGSSDLKRIREVHEVHQQFMNFASLHKMQLTVRDALQPFKYGYHTHSMTFGHTQQNLSESVHNADDQDDEEEGRYHEYKEFMLSDVCRVFQRCNQEPHKIVKNIPSKYEHLAQRMIEHGPYRFDFDPVELGDLFDSASNIFGSEPNLLELSGDISIYGNLEGSYGDLFRWLHKNGWPPKRRVLFLGGLTSDAEPYSLETITLIFAMKKIMPQHVFVVRGASEVYPIRLEEGRFPRRITRCLKNVINRCCAHLPLAATIGPVFCAHGGFPETSDELAKIAEIRRPIFEVPEGCIAAKLIFSQAAPNEGPIPGCRGVGFSQETRPDLQNPKTGQTFALFVRARNMCTNGYLFIGDVILNLWSAVGVPSENKGGASLYIDCDMSASLNKMVTFGLYTEEELKKHNEEKKIMENEKRKKAKTKGNCGQKKKHGGKIPSKTPLCGSVEGRDSRCTD